MKKILILMFFPFIVSTFAQNADLNIGTDLYWPAPNITKPAYLSQITESDFGTKITRIVGNPGDSIPNITGKVWADSTLRHGYSKRQPWNSDMSIIYIGKHYPNLWLDGETYEVLFTRNKPASRVRWSNTEPHIMYYVESDDTGLLGKWDVVEDTTSILVDFSGYKSCSFGSGEGNFTNDGKKAAVLGTRKSDGHKVIFVVDIENGTKGTDIDMSAYPRINNCTISPLGNYIIVGGDFGNGSDRFQVRDASSGNLLWEETGYGMPSHFDTQIDQEGNEVIAGVAKSDPYKGWVIKRNLATGDTTVVSVYPNTESNNNSWASHTSGRALNRQGWVFVTHQTTTENRKPYINELVAVKLDGSRVERITHLYNNHDSLKNINGFNDVYNFEAQAVPSPDGLRVIWASDFNNYDYPVQDYVVDFRNKAFSKDKYVLNTSTIGTGTGNLSLFPNTSSFDDGSIVTITAVPDNGSEFSGWSGDLSGYSNPAAITMNSDKNVTAIFNEILNGEITSIINAASDDAEEYANGTTKLNSPDLELVNDGVDNDQTIGLRFTEIDIPHGAIITSAYIEFNARDNTSSSTSLQFLGEDVDSSTTFLLTANNITSRNTTSAIVNWEPTAWSSNSFEQTPNLSGIIQEIINRSNWKSGNALSIIVSGTGKRRAWSFDGTGTAPKLHVEYSLGNNSFMAQVSNSTDDAEEYANGSTKLSSPDLELVNDGSDNDQTIGIRFSGINIPKGVTILSAYLEFTAKDNLNNSVSLTLKTEDVDNSPQFATSVNNITNRHTSNSFVSWEPNAWEDGKLYQSPELKSIIQEIISRSGWSNENALSFIIDGSGKRRAWSYDGNGTAPKLYIIYKEGDINLAFEINSSNNDAEEYENGTMRLTSSDLELVNNGSNNDQTVGMRFSDITIPKNSTILNAYLEFVAKDEEDGNVSLNIKAENVDNPNQFSSTAYDISNRITTSSSVNWSPEPWVGGVVYQTNDIKTIVQNIINREGWQSGNALSIIITGTGKRRAWSYDGNGNAPKLYIKHSNALAKQLDFGKNILPKVFALDQNYPNPFNPTTVISFALPKASDVQLSVYNIHGQKVVELINNEMVAGNHTVNFNAINLTSGIYIYRIKAGNFVSVKKMLLLK